MAVESIIFAVLVACAAGGLGYVFLDPILSGGSVGARRQQLVAGGTVRRKAVAEAGKSANAQTRVNASISRGNARGVSFVNPGYSNIRPMPRQIYARGGSRRRQRKSKKSRKHRNKKTRRNR
jgi:hypothetical protein